MWSCAAAQEGRLADLPVHNSTLLATPHYWQLHITGNFTLLATSHKSQMSSVGPV
jgi:hypothetical protein